MQANVVQGIELSAVKLSASTLSSITDSLPAVEEEAAGVGLDRVLAAVVSLCWLTTDGWRRRAPGTAAWPVWKV